MISLKKISKDIKDYVGGNLITLILFGSYARGDQTKYSDMDILAIVKDKVSVDRLEKNMFKKYKKTVEIHAITKSRFKEEVIGYNEMMPHLFKFGKVLYDKEDLFKKMKNLFKALHGKSKTVIATEKEKLTAADVR